ncbi:TolC family protein [Methylomonas montana]|uniref:TolC family protein n=1 Tax=Methylomonas montana TaxID=3058963 RepID=UPI0026594793|nr:TolC family protein [Methylomonas montana]WKJ91624.1 TolC family protein [Methylomonas montana]
MAALLPVSAVIAAALPSLSLVAGRELPLFFPLTIESVRVVGDDIATVRIEGKRLSIKATRPGTAEVELQLAGETSPRTLLIKALAAQVGEQPVVSLATSTAKSARSQQAVHPSPEDNAAQSRPSHREVPVTLHPAEDTRQHLSDASIQWDYLPRQAPIEVPPAVTTIATATSTNTNKSMPGRLKAGVQPLLKEGGEGNRQGTASLPQEVIDIGVTSAPGRDVSAEGGVASHSMTLLRAVNLGLARHPDVKSAMAKVEQFTTEVAIAEGGYYPTLEASAGPTKSINGNLGYNYNLTATQMLYDWGRVESQVDSASANQRQQAEVLLVMREDAALDISEIYLDVLMYRQRIAAVRGHVERLEELNELSRQRGEAGYMDRTELGRVGLEVARAREQLAIEQGNLQNAVRQYQELIGESAEGLAEPALEVFSGRLADKDELERAITASPLYRQATEKTAIEEAKVHEADAALLPQLDLEGSLLRRPLGGQMTDDAIIGLRVRMEPFQGLSNFQRTDAARQRLEAAKWDMGTSQRDIRRKVLSLIESESALKWREPALDEQIKNSRDVSSAYREQFVAGLRTMNDLLNIFQERLAAERQLIDLQYERKRVQYRAAAQLGQLVPLLEGRLSETAAP